jgi:hypothetical protein
MALWERRFVLPMFLHFVRRDDMDDYQVMAVKTIHNPETTIAAKQIAHDLLINCGWSEADIEKCRNAEPENVVMILLA